MRTRALNGVGAVAVALAMTAATTTAITAGSALTGAADAASVSQCTGQDKVILKRVVGLKRSFQATHLLIVNLAANTSYSQSTTLDESQQLTASTNMESSVGIEAGWAFAKIHADVSVSVATEGSTTSAKSETRTISIRATKKRHRYIAYSGNTYFQARWHVIDCSRAPGHGVDKMGPIHTFGAEEVGTVMCPRTRYKKGSEDFQIALQGGC